MGSASRWRREHGEHRRLRVVAGFLALALLAGCAKPVEQALEEQLEALGLVARITERGVVVYIPDVLFDFDSRALTPAARDQIVGVAEVIARLAPERTLSVEGHTDAIGTEAYNQSLSLDRAREVEAVLTEHGLDAERLRTVGFGKGFPVQPNTNPDGSDNPDGRRQNRRVEIVIER